MEYAVSTRGLTRVFGDFTAVDDVSIDIRPGEICGFLGPNGAGKTTTIRMICGILTPTAGTATVLGYDLLRETEKIKSHLGYMSQKFSLYEDLTVRQNLNFYVGLYGIAARDRNRKIAEMIELGELTGRENELVGNLSAGVKQRLALGCAIVGQPSLLVLDEPTSGVSPVARRSFFNIIQNLANEGATVIVTTHFMDEAERCNRIAFISDGKLLAFDSPDYLKKSVIEGIMVELEMPGAIERIEEIEKLPGVKECTLHGPLLHVVLQDEAAISQLAGYSGVEPRLVSPSLEDVFIALSKKKLLKQGG
ncbi:MAG: ATP-binding cassette domain-containing protein [Chitinophagales bacterium]